MNKNWLSVLLGALLLCGCRTRYEITLTNASKITTNNRPKYVNGYYVFKDGTGREVRLSSGRVIQIEAKSPWEKSKEPFSGAAK